MLYVRGRLTGSVMAPTGSVTVKLADGAVGNVRLAKANAALALDSQQRLSVDVDMVPADVHGNLKLSGTVALPSTSSSSSSTAQSTQQQAPASSSLQPGTGAASLDNTAAAAGGGELPLDVQLTIKDGGLAVVSSLVPSFGWESGSALLSFRMQGTAISKPSVSGNIMFNKAVINSDYLRHPLTHINGHATLDSQALTVSAFEARSGSKGHVRMQGMLPAQCSTPDTPSSSSSQQDAGQQTQEGLHVNVSNLELKVRNVYTGDLDADMSVAGCLTSPVLGGHVRFSRGVAYLMPQGAATATTPADTLAPANGNGSSTAATNMEESDMVTKAFSALKAGRHRAMDMLRQQVSMTSFLSGCGATCT